LQLLSLGASRDQIDDRIKRRHLHPIHRGVYLVGPIPPQYAYEQAALLALGREAALSHATALYLWHLIPSLPTSIDVTIPPHKTAHRARLVIHRAPLERKDIRRRHGLALTSPPRTILDVAATWDELESLVAEAHYRHLASDQELRAQLERNPHKPGAPRLRAILQLPGGAQRTRSPAEREMVSLLRAAGLTGFEANARIHGYEVDVLFRDHDLVIEVDGYDAHSGRVAFERDRLKRATLTAHGLAVMAVTGRQIRDDPQGVLARILSALAA